MESSSASASLQETPTWALATICFVFIFLSVFIEHLIHLVCLWLKKHRKTALFEAVQKLKSVLMLLGLMSLLLAVIQRPVSRICVSNKIGNSMLPCHKTATKRSVPQLQDFITFQNSRKLSAKSIISLDHCDSKGMTPLISEDGLNQLSIFIFVLAVMQIVYSVATMALGRAKMKCWETWEKETQTVEYLAANDPNRFRYTRETTFGRRHMNTCTTTSPQLWIKCFSRQFFNSVAKIDYFTLRHGFIMAHLSGNNSFNFQKYIQKSLEEDFKTVVGISPLMWLIVVIFLLVDVHGWNVYLWVSFIPLTTVLVVGTKLQVIVARMALRLENQTTIINGTPLVQPNDNLFWFNHPRFIMNLLHFTLFMNAFELAFFIWVTVEFGLNSCYHDNIGIIFIRLALAIIVQVLASYITLPLYALVTQMGSQFKSVILEDQTMLALKQWHAQVREKRKRQQRENNPTRTTTNSAANSGDVFHLHQAEVPILAGIVTRSSSTDDVGDDIIVEEHRQEMAAAAHRQDHHGGGGGGDEPRINEVSISPVEVQLRLQSSNDDHQLPSFGINVIR